MQAPVETPEKRDVGEQGDVLAEAEVFEALVI